MFEFYSHQRLGRGGQSYYCLDLGYCKISDRKVRVFRSKGGVGIFM